ncbi:Transcriptional regulatory protein AfsQ1 [Chromobacterium violaceum]|uniref:Transcriptional regulatory protein AfsQ1 n=1 Tax=Chromobacterium violaceum TaxID=536 RepID=A0A447TIB1_CHRVL|nr:Transcriptional regulatory protein AfsQ1 [Chromobacterium violaceum]
MSSTTILLVEDSATNRYFIEQFIQELGYRCASAKNGVEAVEYCRNQVPDLVLMDIIMPEMDGLQATTELRRLFGEHWVPIIFLTSLNELESVVSGLKAGGDDYLAKPVSFDLLSAKIHVFLRIAQMQNQINQDAVRLEKYYQENEFEQQLALELIERLVRLRTSRPGHVWQYLNPAAGFNGDLIIICQPPGGGEHIMLADCTGHGLTAAISALPAIDCFHEMTEAGCDMAAIARGVNQKLHKLLPGGRFVAAALIAIDADGRHARVWNGGVPACCCSTKRERSRRAASRLTRRWACCRPKPSTTACRPWPGCRSRRWWSVRTASPRPRTARVRCSAWPAWRPRSGAAGQTGSGRLCWRRPRRTCRAARPAMTSRCWWSAILGAAPRLAEAGLRACPRSFCGSGHFMPDARRGKRHAAESFTARAV